MKRYLDLVKTLAASFILLPFITTLISIACGYFINLQTRSFVENLLFEPLRLTLPAIAMSWPLSLSVFCLGIYLKTKGANKKVFFISHCIFLTIGFPATLHTMSNYSLENLALIKLGLVGLASGAIYATITSATYYKNR